MTSAPHSPYAPLAHDPFFARLREREYGRLDLHHQVYLDYTGGNLPAERQLAAHHALLREHTLGNPHSTNPTSRRATELVEAARQAVLEFFQAEHDYYCIFTPNATGALKLVGECYPFRPGSHYLMLADNHNSVNGIREYVRRAGGTFSYAPVRYQDLTIDGELLSAALARYGDHPRRLFAFPAQSNVSGVRHSLEWIDRAHAQGWDVLLDAAAFVPGNPLHLRRCRPDFVSVSFYKIFGYPTGVGCLLVRKDKFGDLCKPWFAGGTVRLAAVAYPDHRLVDGPERFEDGTLNYLDLPAVKIGLDYIADIGMNRIQERTASLMEYLCRHLSALRYQDGSPAVQVFGPQNRAVAGGTAILGFFDARGKRLALETIEARANARNLSLRSGCFCNPGIDEINSRLSGDHLRDFFSGNPAGGYTQMIEFLGRMRGATRVSVGIATIKADLDQFVAFARSLMGE